MTYKLPMRARSTSILLATVLPALAGCTESGNGRTASSADWNMHCASCHGFTGGGVPGLGPIGHRIDDKGEFWDEESLVRYLRSPAAFSKTDPRLQGRMAELPKDLTADDARLAAVARHVLELMGK